MSFWSNLLNIGGAIAAPFTGGASLIPGIVGSAASGIAGGMQKGREGQNQAASDAAAFKLRDVENAESALQGRAGLDLKQRQFGMDSQNNAYANALKSALAMNMKDVVANRPQGVPNISFSGGARPSALGPEGRAAAALMHGKSMSALEKGESFDKLPPIERVSAPEYKTPGFWENLLGGVGMAGNAIEGGLAASQDRTFQQEIMRRLMDLQGGGGSATITGTTDSYPGTPPFVNPRIFG